MEDQCKYVSSRGVLKSCDIFSSTPISDIRQLINYDFSSLKEKSVVYITTSCLPHFVNLIDKIPCKIILVTGDSDVTVDKDYSILSNEKVIHWYAQNCILKNAKLTNLPIGLDYHTIHSNKGHWWGCNKTPLEQEQELITLVQNALPFDERLLKCYSNFHFYLHSNFGNPRKRAMESIDSNLIYYEPEKVPRLESWNEQVKYSFVISPHGGGMDCHRTWEALILGCIPIVEKSEIDPLYSDLPVLIINDYSEITEDLLKNTIHLFKDKKFNYDILLLEYWVNKIKHSG